MVKIPIRETLLIEDAIEKRKIIDEYRPHLGASVLGRKCKREIWYSFHWAKLRIIEPRMKRLFSRGHYEELVTIFDLIQAGCKVEFINIDKSIHTIFKTLFNHDLPEHKQKQGNFAFGFGSGSCDGIIYNLPDSPKTPHLFEGKTYNLKQFARLKQYGLIKAKWEHYVQVQIYMKLFKLKRCLYVAICKDNDERHYQRIKYDSKVAKEYFKLGEELIKSTSAPMKISNDSDSFFCTYCDYTDICHFDENPSKNCRTCENIIFSTDGLNAILKCKLNNKTLNHKKQTKGCKKYKVDRIGFR